MDPAPLSPFGLLSRGGLPGEVNDGRLVEESVDGGRGGFSSLVLLLLAQLTRAVDVVRRGLTAWSRSRTLANRRTSVGLIGEGASTTYERETFAITSLSENKTDFELANGVSTSNPAKPDESDESLLRPRIFTL